MREGWKYKKTCWANALTIINGKNQSAVLASDGQYPIYGSGGVMGYANDYLCPENTVIIGRKGSINKPIYVTTKFWNVDTAFGLCAKKDILNPKYLYYFCIDYDFEKHNKAVTIPSLTKKDLLKIEIKLPILDNQNSVVAELDQINDLIRLKKEQLKEYNNLAQSIFYDMFGDPVVNEKDWKVKPLGEFGFLGRGVSKHRPRNAPELLGGTMPLVQTGDVANSGMYLTTYNSTYSDLGVAQSKIWEKGTLCITIAATIGKCAILSFRACFPDSVVGFLCNEEVCNNVYMYFIFSCLQKILEEEAPAVAQKNINLKKLNRLIIPLPPLPLQQEFSSRIEQIEKLKTEVQKTITDLETLLASRMQYWFE